MLGTSIRLYAQLTLISLTPPENHWDASWSSCTVSEMPAIVGGTFKCSSCGSKNIIIDHTRIIMSLCYQTFYYLQCSFCLFLFSFNHCKELRHWNFSTESLNLRPLSCLQMKTIVYTLLWVYYSCTLISTVSICLLRPLSPGPPTAVFFILVRSRLCIFCSMARDWSTPVLLGVSLRSQSYMEGILGVGGGGGARGVCGRGGGGGGGGTTGTRGVLLSIIRK